LSPWLRSIAIKSESESKPLATYPFIARRLHPNVCRAPRASTRFSQAGSSSGFQGKPVSGQRQSPGKLRFAARRRIACCAPAKVQPLIFPPRHPARSSYLAADWSPGIPSLLNLACGSPCFRSVGFTRRARRAPLGAPSAKHQNRSFTSMRGEQNRRVSGRFSFRECDAR
jgi:hypothetical protein